MLRQVLLERVRPLRPRRDVGEELLGEGGVDRLEPAVVLGLQELGLAGALEHPR